MQTTHEMKEPSHLEFETGADDQPIAEPSQHPEWFSQQKKPPTPDRDWNETLPATHIKVDTLTSKLLARPTYELMKVSCKSLVELEFFLEEVYKATTDQLDWVNPKGQESARDVYSKCRIIAVTELKIVEWHNYKHLDWITMRRDDDKLYKFKMFTRSIVIQRCERPSTRCRKLPEEAQPHKAGYNKDKHNRLMRIDELHKFSDGTLTDVRTALDDYLKGIRMKYLPQTIWRKRVATMIQARDKQLKTRRIMRSLERYKVVRHRYSNPMIQPKPEGSTQGYPLVSVEVLRYDKRGKSKNMGIVLTEMKIILEHIQQGISHEVLVSTEGVEE
nr:hypothetical protein [Tanacetum cinerariifolium]